MQVDPRGPRFGAALTTVVLIVVLVTGSLPLPAVRAAAFLNAGFGLCLGCEAYLLIRRLAPRRATS